MKYSEKTKSFYDLTLNYPDLPDDLIDVTEVEYQSVLIAREEGCPFEFIDGKLTVYDKCPGTFYEWSNKTKTWVLNQEKKDRAAVAAYEANKSALLAHAKEQIDILQDELELELAEDEEVTAAKLKVWKAYRVKLNKVDVINPVWPDLPEKEQ